MIGICGYPGHGKSTVQAILSDLGVSPIDDSLPIRLQAIDRWSLTMEDVTTQAGKSRIIQAYGRKMSVREALGLLGKEREIENPNYWIDVNLDALFMRQAVKPCSFGSVRMNQGAAIKRNHGLVIEIKNPWRAPSDFDFDQYNPDNIDITISNSGDLEDLRSRVLLAVTPYLETPPLGLPWN